MLLADPVYGIKFLEFAVAHLGPVGFDRGEMKLGKFLEYVFGLGTLILFHGFALWTISRKKTSSELSTLTWIGIISYFLLNAFFFG